MCRVSVVDSFSVLAVRESEDDEEEILPRDGVSSMYRKNDSVS